jgi:hypothetical protein
MSHIEALRTGRRGVRLEVPADWEVTQDDDDAATLVDAKAGVQWHLFYFEDVAFDLSDAGWPSLQRDVRQHADYLFEVMRRHEHAQRDPDAPLPPKPPRHPLVSCERVKIDGGDALRVIHRMVMRPGLEIVMGHLLVPAADGLFEARWIARAELTGMRESILLMKAMDVEATGTEQQHDVPGGVAVRVHQVPETGRTDDEIESLMKSIDYDAPEHDADFPQHPLSVVRACARALEADYGLRMLRPAKPVPTGEEILASMSIAFTPPPRFVRTSESGKSAMYRRYSLAGNDGTQILGVEVAPANADLEGLARTILNSAGVLPDTVRRSGALIVCDGTRAGDEARVVIAAAPLDRGKQVIVQLLATTSFLLDDIDQELTAAAQSVRALPRPWWKVW